MYDTSGGGDNPMRGEWPIYGLYEAQRSNNIALARKGALMLQGPEAAANQLNERFKKYMGAVEQKSNRQETRKAETDEAIQIYGGEASRLPRIKLATSFALPDDGETNNRASKERTHTWKTKTINNR